MAEPLPEDPANPPVVVVVTTAEDTTVVIRGDTPHFDFVAGEAASGLQLAALETGVPVAFGVLTLEEADQADDRLEKGAEAVRTGLEMADVFAQLRAAAQR